MRPLCSAPRRARRWSCRTSTQVRAREGAWRIGIGSTDGMRYLAKAQAVADEIKAIGGSAIAVQGDVTAPEFPKKVVDAAVA